MRTCLWIVVLLPAVACAAQTETKKTESPRQQYEALVEQYEQLGGAEKLADKFLELARQNAEQPVALDALGWILINVRSGAQPPQASKLISRDHLQSEQLGAICSKLASTTSTEAETVLRSVLESSPHTKVQAVACFSLAAHLQNQLKIQEALLTKPSLRRRLEQFYGREFTQRVRALDPEKALAQVDRLYERVVQDYAAADESMTEAARKQLIELRYLAIGKTAREIEGEDVEGVTFKLSDYRGKVVMLTFWGHW